jgi:hypothetical protein
VPSAKPQIVLRRPGAPVPSHVAEAFIAGAETPAARVPAPLAPTEEPGSRLPDDSGVGRLALVLDKHPDVQVRGGSDVRPLRAGIVQRRSGRARRRMTVYFDPQLARTLKIYCATNGIELSDFVDAIVRGHFERQPSPSSVPSGPTE